MDLKGLKALVSASPVYFQQYLQDRQHLLCECLETTLGCVAIDACAVYQSGLVDFLRTRSYGSVTQFLEFYKDSYNQSLSHHTSLNELIGKDGIMSIMSFHTSIIMPLAKNCTDWALKNLAQ